MIVRITGRGQIHIPATIRRQLGITRGSRVSIEVRGNEIVVRRVRSICEVEGVFRQYAKGVPVDWETERAEVQDAVALEIAQS